MNLLVIAALMLTAPFIEGPRCEAEIVAQGVPTMSIEDHLEVIDFMEDVGGLEHEHAEQYRALIREAHSAPDLSLWVHHHCSPKSEV